MVGPMKFRQCITFVAIVTILAQLRTEAQERQTMACGPRALAIAALLVQHSDPENSIDRKDIVNAFGSVEEDHTLADIKRAAAKLGLVATFARYDKANPQLPNCPVIVPISSDRLEGFHVAVLFGRDKYVTQFIDYPRSPQFMELKELNGIWIGEGIEIRSAGGRTLSSDLPSLVNSALWLIAAILVAIAGLRVWHYKRRSTR